MVRRNISGFQAGKRKVSSQVRVSVVYSRLELDLPSARQGMQRLTLHWCIWNNTGSDNFLGIHSAQQPWDRRDHDPSPRKSYLDGNNMYHTLVNPNQLRAYLMTVQDNPFSEDPIFIAPEDHNFMLPLFSKGTILGVTTRTPTDQDLHTCPHVTC